MTDELRQARLEAQAQAARLGTAMDKSVLDYNVMMGNIEDPNAEEEEENE